MNDTAEHDLGIVPEWMTDQGKRVFKWLFDHPAYFIPLIALYAYLIITTFAGGYLQYFSAQPHWFDPSIFQLVALARVPFVLALGVVLLLATLMLRADTGRGEWAVLFISWSAIATVILLWTGVAYIHYKSRVPAVTIGSSSSCPSPHFVSSCFNFPAGRCGQASRSSSSVHSRSLPCSAFLKATPALCSASRICQETLSASLSPAALARFALEMAPCWWKASSIA